jgi:DNA mismatch repair protein MutS2
MSDSSNNSSSKPLQRGDSVRRRESFILYEIIDGPNAKNEYCLVVGIVKIWIPGVQLIKIDAVKSQKENFSRRNSQNGGKTSLSIDLHGLRADEAKNLIEKSIDEAIFSQIGQIEFIHGFGNGVLKEILHDYLKARKEVSRFSIALGNPGATLVWLD